MAPDMAPSTALLARLITRRDEGIVVHNVDKAYMGILAVWTAFLVLGCALLHRYQHTYFIRMRNIRLSITAVATIHIYLAIIWSVHLIRPRFPCDAEFWVMSIYLPFGVALWQAHNMQLLQVSVQQRELCGVPRLRARFALPKRLDDVKGWWRRLGWLHKTYSMIAVGMAIQFLITLIIYLGSRRFKAWGSFGAAVNQGKCRRGWEWLPSIFWQALWAYGFGPFILFRIRNIHDTHHWRLQTILSIVLSMPGTPLWIAALYSPSFDKINDKWVPPLWFAPGIMIMQFVSIWCPLIELYQQRNYRPGSPTAVVAQWESQRAAASKSKFDWRLSRAPSSLASSTKSASTLRKTNPNLYTMQALARALARDPAPLLNFAATKQFTGENIIFLVQVRDWRTEWNLRCAQSGTSSQPGAPSEEDRRRLFASAVEIFAQSVSMKTSPFPVNIESKIYAQLDSLFGEHVNSLTRTNSTSSSSSHGSNVPNPHADITPFADDAFLLKVEQQSAKAMIGFGSTTTNAVEMEDKSTNSSRVSIVETSDELGDGVAYDSRDPLPKEFDISVWDQAEKSVLYMVFTNTWSRFVDAQSETMSMLSSTTGTNHSQHYSMGIKEILTPNPNAYYPTSSKTNSNSDLRSESKSKEALVIDEDEDASPDHTRRRGLALPLPAFAKGFGKPNRARSRADTAV